MIKTLLILVNAFLAKALQVAITADPPITNSKSTLTVQISLTDAIPYPDGILKIISPTDLSGLTCQIQSPSSINISQCETDGLILSLKFSAAAPSSLII